MTIRLVILDRDGTLVVGPPEGEYLTDPDAVVLMPGAADAIRRWRAAGCSVVVATNQRCVALGLATEEQVAAVNARIGELLEEQGASIDRWYVCPHGTEPGGVPTCDCRKPLPGMLERAMKDAGVTPAQTVMVGDSDADLGAAAAAGVRGLRPTALDGLPAVLPTRVVRVPTVGARLLILLGVLVLLGACYLLVAPTTDITGAPCGSPAAASAYPTCEVPIGRQRIGGLMAVFAGALIAVGGPMVFGMRERIDVARL